MVDGEVHKVKDEVIGKLTKEVKYMIGKWNEGSELVQQVQLQVGASRGCWEVNGVVEVVADKQVGGDPDREADKVVEENLVQGTNIEKNTL